MTDYGLLTSVTALPRATSLEVDAAIGDTTLTVDYAGDFNSEDGGTLDLNGARLAYTGITDGAQPSDSDTIILAAPLGVGATTGDTVSVVAGGQILTDYVAHVVMGIGDEVHVPLDVYQVPMWPLGDYTDPVPVEVSDDLLHLQDAPGRTTTATPDPVTLNRAVLEWRLSAADFAAFPITNGSSGNSPISTWGTPEELIGAGIDTSSDSWIFLNQPGVYAISYWMRINGLNACSTAMRMWMRCDVDEAISTAMTTPLAHGGEPDGAIFYGSSRVYYNPGVGSSGGHQFKLFWENFDAVNCSAILLEVSVQQIT